MINIYSINYQNKPIYIGQTKKSIDSRWCDHKSRAKTEKNKRKEKLYNKIRKYGIENFAIQPLCVVEDYMADETEIKCISAFDTIKNGCNLAIGGRVNRGMKRSEETKQKYSKISKERYKKGRCGLAQWNGSQKQKEFLSNLKKGKDIPWRDKINETKSQGPYEIIIDNSKHIYKYGLNSFGILHNLNSASLKLALKNNKSVKTKGHTVTVKKVTQ